MRTVILNYILDGKLYAKLSYLQELTSWCREKGTLVHCLWKCKFVQPLWRTVWKFLKKLKIKLPYDPIIPFLGIYLEKHKVWKDTWTPMFIAALFIIDKTWRHAKCPLTEEWINMWYMYIQGNITQPLKRMK